jgi:squalene cyclase
MPDYLWLAEDGMKMQVGLRHLRVHVKLRSTINVPDLATQQDHQHADPYSQINRSIRAHGALVTTAVRCLLSMQGYNGSQLWDTAFAVQALAATQLGDQLGDSLAKAGSFIEATQVHCRVA